MSELFQVVTKDNLTLNGKIWSRDKSKATIILIHGFGEHLGRYEHVAAYLNSQDLSVIAVDIRGHGKSNGKRGHTPSYDLLMDDIDRLVNYSKQKMPDQSLVLYGHSMGGNLAANYILRQKGNSFNALILTSPWLRLQFEPPRWQVAMGQLMRKVWPAFSQPNNLNPDDLSTDLSVGKAYASDPLVNDKITTEMFFSISEAGEWVIKNGSEIELPTLVLHGADDPITSHMASREFANNAGAEYKLWPGMRHEMHNEVGQEKVLEAIFQWTLRYIN